MLLSDRLLGEAIVEVEENHRKHIEQLQVENQYLRKQLKIHQDQLEILRKYNKNLRTDLEVRTRNITDYFNDHQKRLIKIETRLFVNDHSLR